MADPVKQHISLHLSFFAWMQAYKEFSSSGTLGSLAAHGWVSLLYSVIVGCGRVCKPYLIPVLTFPVCCLISVPLLKVAALVSSSVQMFPVVHGFWLGYVHHCDDDFVDALFNEAGDLCGKFLNAIR